METRYYIANDISVDSRFRVNLAESGTGEKCVALYASPSFTRPGEIVIYMATNADPVYAATIDADNKLCHFQDDFDESFINDHLGCEILSNFGFVPDDETYEFGAEDFLLELLNGYTAH